MSGLRCLSLKMSKGENDCFGSNILKRKFKNHLNYENV